MLLTVVPTEMTSVVWVTRSMTTKYDVEASSSGHVAGASKASTPVAKVDGSVSVQSAAPGSPLATAFRVTVRWLPAVPVLSIRLK